MNISRDLNAHWEREREKECIAGLNQVAFKNLVEVSATEYFSFFFFF